MHRSGWRACRKVRKDSWILLTPLFLYVKPSLLFRINVLISFGTLLMYRDNISQLAFKVVVTY